MQKGWENWRISLSVVFIVLLVFKYTSFVWDFASNAEKKLKPQLLHNFKKIWTDFIVFSVSVSPN